MSVGAGVDKAAVRAAPVVEAVTEADRVRVRGLGLFAPLPREAVEALLDQAHQITLPPLGLLFEADQPASHLFVVMAGVVGTMAVVSPHETCLIELVGPGRLLGEAGLFDSRCQSLAAQAITEARLAAIPAPALRACLDIHAGLRRQMLALLSRRLRLLIRQITQLKLMSASQRLGSFLAGLLEPRPGPQTVRLACERQVIAGLLGMTPECLSRSFGQLRALGVRSRGKREILVEDRARLQAFVAGDGA